MLANSHFLDTYGRIFMLIFSHAQLGRRSTEEGPRVRLSHISTTSTTIHSKAGDDAVSQGHSSSSIDDENSQT